MRPTFIRRVCAICQKPIAEATFTIGYYDAHRACCDRIVAEKGTTDLLAAIDEIVKARNKALMGGYENKEMM